jgi:hypothetical protein
MTASAPYRVTKWAAPRLRTNGAANAFPFVVRAGPGIRSNPEIPQMVQKLGSLQRG